VNRAIHNSISLLAFLIGASVFGGLWTQEARVTPKVAFLFSDTGSSAAIEREMKRGAQVFSLKHGGEIDKLSLEYFDNKGTVEGTLTALKKIQNREIRFVVGLRKGDEALAASQVAEENELLFVTPLSMFSKTTLGKKNTFQISGNEVLVGAALADFAVKDLARKKILILVNQGSVYSQAFSAAFKKAVKTKADIAIEQHVSSGTDLKLELLKAQVLKFKPDLIFISDDISNSAVLAKYIHQTDPFLPFLAGESFGNESAIKLMLKEVPRIRLYFASFWSPSLKSFENEKFKQGYQELFPNKKASQEAALTYDALLVFLRAFELTRNEITVDRVRYHLEHQSFETTQGQIDFKTGPTHSPIRNILIKVTNSSKTKLVKTLRVKWKLEP